MKASKKTFVTRQLKLQYTTASRRVSIVHGIRCTIDGLNTNYYLNNGGCRVPLQQKFHDRKTMTTLAFFTLTETFYMKRELNMS